MSESSHLTTPDGERVTPQQRAPCPPLNIQHNITYEASLANSTSALKDPSQVTELPTIIDNISVILDNEQLGSSTVTVESSTDEDYRELQDRSNGSEVVLKVFNDNVLELDVVKLLTSSNDIITTVDDTSCYNGSHCSRPLSSYQDNSRNMLESSNREVGNDPNLLCGSQLASHFWQQTTYDSLQPETTGHHITDGHNIERQISEPITYQVSEPDACQISEPIARQSEGSLNAINKAVQFRVKSELPQDKLNTSIGSTQYADGNTLNCYRTNTRTLNLSSQRFDLDFSSTDCSLKIVIDGESDDTATIEKYCICPICDVEIDNSLSVHLATHSKHELIKALVKSTNMHKRPAKRKSVVPAIKTPISQNNSKCFRVYRSTLNSRQGKRVPRRNERISNLISKQRVEVTINDSENNNDCIPLSNNLPNHLDISCKEEPSDPDDVLEISELCSSEVSVQVTTRSTKKKRCSSRVPLPCPVCGKIFSNRGNLSKHMTLHSTLKPWNCSICNIGFNSNRAWDHHHLQNHSGDRSLACPVCSKTFAVRDNLKEHLVFHGPKTKTCDICAKSFWTQKCVTRHRKRHFPEKKHKCGMCSKSFAIKWDYRLHCKKVHGVDQCS